MNPRYLISRIRDNLARHHIARVCSTNIHPTAKVAYANIAAHSPAELEIGEGSIFEGRIIAERPGAIVRVGNNTYVGSSSLICATSIDIGDDVLISWGCTIVDHHSHSLNWEYRRDDVRDWYIGRKDWTHVKTAPIRICNKAWIGFNAIILAGVTIGEGAVVGCGSIVTRDVRPYAVVAGSPARVINELASSVATHLIAPKTG